MTDSMPDRSRGDRTDRIDRTDARLLERLQVDGRRPYADLGADVGISGPSAHERVKKLEARGVIRGYAASVDPAAAGYGITAFSWLTQAPGTPGRTSPTRSPRSPRSRSAGPTSPARPTTCSRSVLATRATSRP